MGKPDHIALPGGERIRILYEDRSVLALDKPAGWMLAPESWQNTGRNLHSILMASIQRGDFWAKSRNLKYLRFVHRLDAETTGIVLMARSVGAVAAYSDLFEKRKVMKVYLAVTEGKPPGEHWICRERLAADPNREGRMIVDDKQGKEAETEFRVIEINGGRALLEVRPLTGRTHQIRVHLQSSGCPVLGDAWYGRGGTDEEPLGLRAVELAYRDPFTRRSVRIRAPRSQFLTRFGFCGNECLENIERLNKEIRIEQQPHKRRH